MERIKRYAVPSFFALLAVPALCIDVPVARLARSAHAVATNWRELLENLESFGHAAGVGTIVVLIHCLDVERRRRVVPSTLLAAFGAGIAANIVKLLVHRDRPWLLDQDVTHGLDTFRGLWPGLTATSAGQSFPSAHAATAMGLAVALAHHYREARWLFLVLAGATALSRVVAGSHYVSDVLAGLALGLLVGRLVVASFRSDKQTVLRADDAPTRYAA